MKFTLNESAEGNAAGVPLAAPGSEESAVRANGKKPSSSKRFWEKPAVREEFFGYLFALPVILGLIIFTFIPAVQGFVYAFFNYNGFTEMEFVGLKNFVTFFTLDRDMPYLFRNTFTFAIINVPLSMVLGYVIALLVNTSMKGVRVFRTIFYLPCVIPGVASALLWQDLFAVNGGIMNQILSSLGLPTGTFFDEASSSMATFIWTTTWSAGGSMVIWLAAFKNVPTQLYEAATLDGADYMQKVFYVTIPMSTPMIFYNLINGIIGSLQMFNTFIVASNTGGRGIDNSLYMFAVKIYRTAFVGTNTQLGYASAVGIVLFVIILILTAVAFRTNKWVHYSEDD